MTPTLDQDHFDSDHPRQPYRMRIQIHEHSFLAALQGTGNYRLGISCTGEFVQLASGVSTLFSGRLLHAQRVAAELVLVFEVQELE